MPKFILFDEDNILSARYDSAINSVIPAEAVEVSEQIFLQTINENDGNWKLASGQVTKLPFPALTREKLVAKQMWLINQATETAIGSIKMSYPSSEVLSWSKQETEARAYQADSSAITPLIDALAVARGVDKTYLVDKIIEKADQFAVISGALIGKRQKLEDQLNVLPLDATPEDVAAIQW